jgi:2'-5' RNA ligase
MAIRLFVALRPPPPIREQLFDLMDGVPGARWQDDEHLHLTVRFIGEVERHLADDLVACLGQVHAPAPIVQLAGVGRFAHRGRTGALWAAVTPERRAFLPHVTLARLSRSIGGAPEIDRWLADSAGLASAPFALSHLTLYQSHLGRDGATYEPVMRWPLGTAMER